MAGLLAGVGLRGRRAPGRASAAPGPPVRQRPTGDRTGRRVGRVGRAVRSPAVPWRPAAAARRLRRRRAWLLWVAFLQVFGIRRLIGKRPLDVWNYLFTVPKARGEPRRRVREPRGDVRRRRRSASSPGMVAAIVVAVLFVLFQQHRADVPAGRDAAAVGAARGDGAGDHADLRARPRGRRRHRRDRGVLPGTGQHRVRAALRAAPVARPRAGLRRESVDGAAQGRAAERAAGAVRVGADLGAGRASSARCWRSGWPRGRASAPACSPRSPGSATRRCGRRWCW